MKKEAKLPATPVTTKSPITDANRDAALFGADITEDEHEVQLRAERPVVTKETVPSNE